jgi:hypothetical protein
MERVLTLSLLVVGVLGCGDRSINTDCKWPAEEPRRLDLRQSSDVTHLRQDVELAEEFSIRYGDVRWSPGFARANGRDTECLMPLLGEIVSRHGVPLEVVLETRRRLGPQGVNLVVDAPIGMFYALLSWLIIRQIYRRFSFQDEMVAVVVASVMAAILVAGLTVAVGRLWEGGIEIVRIGNDHLSYRGLRLRWTRFPLEFFVSGITLFGIISFGHYWLIIRRSDPRHAKSGYAV